MENRSPAEDHTRLQGPVPPAGPGRTAPREAPPEWIADPDHGEELDEERDWRDRWEAFWKYSLVAEDLRGWSRALPIAAVALVLLGIGLSTGMRPAPGFTSKAATAPASTPSSAPAKRPVTSAVPPAQPETRAELAEEFLRSDRLADAAAEFGDLLKDEESRSAGAVGLSRIALRAGAPRQAREIAEAAVRIAPKDPKALHTLGVAQAKSGQQEEALKSFSRALRERPQDVALLLNSAALYARDGEWKKARELCVRAREQQPQRPAPRLLLASILCREGRIEEGLAELQELVRLHPKDAAAHVVLGRAALVNRRFEPALAAFERAAALRPEWTLPALDAGEVLLRLRRFDAARARFEPVAAKEPKNVRAQMGIAQALSGMGEYVEAIARYEKLLVLQPEQPQLLNDLAYLYTTTGTQPQRAVELARKAYALAPGNPSVCDTLGWAEYRAGKPEAALPYLRKAAQKAVRSGVPRFHLATVLRATGQHAGALAAVRAALATELPPSEARAARSLLEELMSRARPSTG